LLDLPEAYSTKVEQLRVDFVASGGCRHFSYPWGAAFVRRSDYPPTRVLDIGRAPGRRARNVLRPQPDRQKPRFPPGR
jgi:hypothetical protein